MRYSPGSRRSLSRQLLSAAAWGLIGNSPMVVVRGILPKHAGESGNFLLSAHTSEAPSIINSLFEMGKVSAEGVLDSLVGEHVGDLHSDSVQFNHTVDGHHSDEHDSYADLAVDITTPVYWNKYFGEHLQGVAAEVPPEAADLAASVADLHASVAAKQHEKSHEVEVDLPHANRTHEGTHENRTHEGMHENRTHDEEPHAIANSTHHHEDHEHDDDHLKALSAEPLRAIESIDLLDVERLMSDFFDYFKVHEKMSRSVEIGYGLSDFAHNVLYKSPLYGPEYSIRKNEIGKPKNESEAEISAEIIGDRSVTAVDFSEVAYQEQMIRRKGSVVADLSAKLSLKTADSGPKSNLVARSGLHYLHVTAQDFFQTLNWILQKERIHQGNHNITTDTTTSTQRPAASTKEAFWRWWDENSNQISLNPPIHIQDVHIPAAKRIHGYSPYDARPMDFVYDSTVFDMIPLEEEDSNQHDLDIDQHTADSDQDNEHSTNSDAHSSTEIEIDGRGDLITTEAPDKNSSSVSLQHTQGNTDDGISLAIGHSLQSNIFNSMHPEHGVWLSVSEDNPLSRLDFHHQQEWDRIIVCHHGTTAKTDTMLEETHEDDEHNTYLYFLLRGAHYWNFDFTKNTKLGQYSCSDSSEYFQELEVAHQAAENGEMEHNVEHYTDEHVEHEDDGEYHHDEYHHDEDHHDEYHHDEDHHDEDHHDEYHHDEYHHDEDHHDGYHHDEYHHDEYHHDEDHHDEDHHDEDHHDGYHHDGDHHDEYHHDEYHHDEDHHDEYHHDEDHAHQEEHEQDVTEEFEEYNGDYYDPNWEPMEL